MATTAFTSQGTTLAVTISATPTTITGIVGLRGPAITWNFDNITNLASPSNFEEFKPITKTPDSVAFELIWNPADAAQTYLQTANGSGSLEVFLETLANTDASTVGYSAYVSKFEHSVEQGKAARVSVELKPTGAVTFTL